MMSLRYLIYRIFETKWKHKVFDEAINETTKITSINDIYIDNTVSQLHYNKANELMELII